MKTALKRISSAAAGVMTATSDVIVKTIVLANTSSKSVYCKLYVEKSGSSESNVVFNGNVYPNTNISVYISKDIQFYLNSGDRLLSSASHLDGTSLSDYVLDVVVSYEGSGADVSSSSSSSSSLSSSSSSLSSSSSSLSSSSSGSSFKNYNRSSSKLSSHVNWGLLRSAIPNNYPTIWGSS